MSSFIYLILVIIIALALSRYNESNKLFWTLFVSLMLGIAGWTFYHKFTTNDKIKRDNFTYYDDNVTTSNNIPNLFDIVIDESTFGLNHKTTCKVVKESGKDKMNLFYKSPEVQVLDLFYDDG